MNYINISYHGLLQALLIWFYIQHPQKLRELSNINHSLSSFVQLLKGQSYLVWERYTQLTKIHESRCIFMSPMLTPLSRSPCKPAHVSNVQNSLGNKYVKLH